MVNITNYYEVLGVAKSASADEIKQAYRKLARKYHPDVSREPDAEARMKALNEANEILSDPEKRAAYDQLRENPAAGSRSAAGSGFQGGRDYGFSAADFAQAEGRDFADLFADLFANRHRDAAQQRRGEDIHAQVTIDLIDAYQGATRVINMRVPETDEQGRVAMKNQALNVQIPKGVREGQHLRLTGRGQPGRHGGPAGELYLEIQFKPDARYRIDGRDVHETVPVSPWEAALGGAIEVKTPAGRVKVTVPANTQNGSQLRLKGRGIPGEPAGDLYLLLTIVLPRADTAQAREAYAAMARQFDFDPRQQPGD